ncbi:MAG: hypothetical protein ACJ765_11350 [Chloroflexota bacterium]
MTPRAYWRLAWAAPALGVLAVSWAPAALAADPTSVPSLPPIEAPPNIQAWLDSDFITPDAPAGGLLQAGFSFWDTRGAEFFQPGDIYVRMRPGTGKAPPSEAKIENDFPGHVVATIEVPEGGPGDVEVGMLVPACIEGGACSDQEAPFKVAGTGPPPDAPLTDLISATFQPLVGDTIAGREFPVAVDVVPRGQWNFADMPLPDHLVVVARANDGTELSTGDLSAPSTPGRPYTGRLTIPETGNAVLVVAVPRDDGSHIALKGSELPLAVIEGGRRESPAPSASAGPASPRPPGSTPDGIPPIAWVIGIGGAAVAAFFVLRRLLADL